GPSAAVGAVPGGTITPPGGGTKLGGDANIGVGNVWGRGPTLIGNGTNGTVCEGTICIGTPCTGAHCNGTVSTGGQGWIHESEGSIAHGPIGTTHSGDVTHSVVGGNTVHAPAGGHGGHGGQFVCVDVALVAAADESAAAARLAASSAIARAAC